MLRDTSMMGKKGSITLWLFLVKTYDEGSQEGTALVLQRHNVSGCLEISALEESEWNLSL